MTRSGGNQAGNRERQEEVARFLGKLSHWGLNLDTLIKNTPPNWKEREEAKQAALYLAQNPDLLEQFATSGNFSCDPGPEKPSLSLYKLQYHRPYIAAAALLMSGDFPHLHQYLLPSGGAKIAAAVLKSNDNGITILEDSGEFKNRRWPRPVTPGEAIGWYDYGTYLLYTFASLLLFVLAFLMFKFLITAGPL